MIFCSSSRTTASAWSRSRSRCNHAHHADNRPHDLAADVIKAAVLIIICARIACRKQHDQTKAQQSQSQQQKRNIKIPPDIQRGHLAGRCLSGSLISGRSACASGPGSVARVLHNVGRDPSCDIHPPFVGNTPFRHLQDLQ